MEKQVLNPEESPEAGGKLPSAIQPQFTSEEAGWGAFERNERGPFVGMEERWETQWQQFLKTLQPGSMNEEHVDFLYSEKETLEAVKRENEEVEISMLGPEVKSSSHPSPLFPSERFGMVQTAVREAFMGLKETEACLQATEWKPTQPIQPPVAWQVLQEEEENVGSLESRLETQFKMENSENRGEESESTCRRDQEFSSGNLPVKVEMVEEGYKSREQQLKPTWGVRTNLFLQQEFTPPITAEKAAISKENNISLFSQYDRRYLYHVELNEMPSTEKLQQYPQRFEDSCQLTSSTNPNGGNLIIEKRFEISGNAGVNNVNAHPSSHLGETGNSSEHANSGANSPAKSPLAKPAMSRLETQFKMENSENRGEESESTCRRDQEFSSGNLPVKVEMVEEGYKSREQQLKPTLGCENQPISLQQEFTPAITAEKAAISKENNISFTIEDTSTTELNEMPSTEKLQQYPQRFEDSCQLTSSTNPNGETSSLRKGLKSLGTGVNNVNAIQAAILEKQGKGIGRAQLCTSRAQRRSKESGETAMKVPHFAGAETEEGAGKPASLVQPLYMTELPTCGASQKIKMEPLMGMEERWEAQWQEFLRTLHPGRGGNLVMMSEASPWEDPKAFLASFEQVATACQWPRGEWTARLRPALSGGAEEAFQTLEDRDQEDYGRRRRQGLFRRRRQESRLETQFKMENSENRGEESESTCRRDQEFSSGNLPVKVEMVEEGYKSREQQLKPTLGCENQPISLQQEFTPAITAEKAAISKENNISLFSQYDRRYLYHVELNEMPSTEKLQQYPQRFEDSCQLTSSTNPNGGNLIIEKRFEISGNAGVNNVNAHPSSHLGETGKGIGRAQLCTSRAQRRSKESGETAMKVPHFSGAETEEGAGKPTSLVQPLYTTELPTCGASQKIKMEPLMGTEERWEAQWQEFLRTLHPGRGGNPVMMSEASPWEDPKAFLASFEQVATACQWPRGEWMARLRPALSGGAEEAFQTLEDRDQEDYGRALESNLQMKLIRLFLQKKKAGSLQKKKAGSLQKKKARSQMVRER
ncbi:hypothetical protein E2320_014471 [Naja naja]|nr:hypothetical protein E2320_014471 [Naja naja]